MIRVNNTESLLDKIWHIVYISPLGLPLALSGMSIVAMTFLLLEKFNTTLVLLIGVPISFSLYYAFYRLHSKSKPSKEVVVTSVLAIVLVLSWSILNSFFTSQHVQVDRDPAIYSVAALHLINNESILIQKTGLMDGVDTITESTPGFSVIDSNPDVIYVQSSHLFPSLLALIGSVIGNTFLFHINPIFGGLAIFAVFGFARLLMRPWWALLTSLAFSVSLPLIYFSRDTYTEPLLSAFVFGALGMMALAFRYKKIALWAMAGLVAGAAMLTRVDATISVVGLVMGIGLLLALSKKDDRVYAIKSATAFMSVFGVLFFAAWYDLYRFSSQYFNDHQEQIMSLYILFASLLVIGTIVAIISWKTAILGFVDDKTRNYRGKISISIFFIMAVILASRPFWLIGIDSKVKNMLLESIQRLQGFGIDGSRDYSENTISWMIWYVGPVLVVMSLAGFAYAIHKAAYSKNIIWIMSIGSVFAVSILYLIKPSITPDQIWASRRFLPVTIPGIAIFGMLGLQMLHDAGKGKRILRYLSISATVVLLPLSVIYPLMTSYPFLSVRTSDSQLYQTNDVCHALPENAVIVWYATASNTIVRPTAAVCHTDNYRTTLNVYDKKIMSDAYSRAYMAGKILYVGLYGDQMGLIPIEYKAKFSSVSKISFNTLEQTIDRPPNSLKPISYREVMIGKVEEDGSVSKF